MTKRNRRKQGTLEERLRGGPGPEAAGWERLRRALAERAAAEGLVDVAFERHASPLGAIVLGATPEGLVRVGLPAEGEDAVLEELARLVSPRVLCAAREPVTRARRQLDEYFVGRRRSFELPLDWRLAKGFRREVLRATARIPYGRTATYGEVAGEAGSPRAFRAAGSALAHNPLPIVVPCHRVLPASGGLGDYRGGAAAKAQLLRLEEAR
jgi:methylated-DNA-[protein]-cysteine S-methyltransferase